MLGDKKKVICERYIPIAMGEWDKTKAYEQLMVVFKDGKSYTSRCNVPAGVELGNTKYWVVSSDWNAELGEFASKIELNNEKTERTKADDNLTKAISDEVLLRSEDISECHNKIKSESDNRISDIKKCNDEIIKETLERKNDVEEIKLKKSDKFKKPFRYLFVSDIHYSSAVWYGYETVDRMNKFVENINEEIRNNDVDAIFILGDITTDNYSGGGSMQYGTSFVDRFVKETLPKINHDNVFIIPGNHDRYPLDEWRNKVGIENQYTVVDRDRNMVFIMLDNYSNSDTTNHNNDGLYTPVDTAYLQAEINKYPDMCIVICGHNFNMQVETPEFKSIIKNNDNILCLIRGHSHKSTPIILDEDCGNKIMLQSGNFSYSNDDDIYDGFLGYRDLRLTNEGIKSDYIVPAFSVTIDGVTTTREYSTHSSTTFLSDDVDFSIENAYDISHKKYNTNEEYYSLNIGKKIDKNANLNYFIKPGVYTALSSTIINSCANKPNYTFEMGCKLIVENTIGKTDYITQTIIAHKYGYTFKRTYKPVDGTWYDWSVTNLASLNESTELYGKTVENVLQLGYNHKYLLLTSTPQSVEFPKVGQKCGVWEVYLIKCDSGNAIGYVKLSVVTPYDGDSGKLLVTKVEEVGTNDVNYTVTGTSISFNAVSYAYRLQARRIS